MERLYNKDNRFNRLKIDELSEILSSNRIGTRIMSDGKIKKKKEAYVFYIEELIDNGSIIVSDEDIEAIVRKRQTRAQKIKGSQEHYDYCFKMAEAYNSTNYKKYLMNY